MRVESSISNVPGSVFSIGAASLLLLALLRTDMSVNEGCLSFAESSRDAPADCLPVSRSGQRLAD